MFPCAPFSDIYALKHEIPNLYFPAIVNDLHLYFVFQPYYEQIQLHPLNFEGSYSSCKRRLISVSDCSELQFWRRYYEFSCF